MTELKIVDESLQISLNGTILLVTPKNLCAIDVLALYNNVPTISIYNKFLGNSTTIFNQSLATCQDGTGTPFTISSFIAFAEANLGFDTIGGGGVTLNYGLFAQTSLGNIIVPASGEANLIGTGVGTLSVPANAFKVGDSFTAKLCGYLNCGNNQDLHIRVKSDGNVIADAGVFRLSIATNKFFEISLDFTISKIGGLGVGELFTNGQFSYNKNANNNIDGTNFALVDSTMFDTTTTNDLSITAEWITSNVSNSIQSQNFVLTKVY